MYDDTWIGLLLGVKLSVTTKLTESTFRSLRHLETTTVWVVIPRSYCHVDELRQREPELLEEVAQERIQLRIKVGNLSLESCQ